MHYTERKETALGRGPVVQPKVSETYRETLQCEPHPCETKQEYGAFHALDYNDVMLNELHDRICRLRNRIDSILEIVPETNPSDGAPRCDNSVLNSRLNTQGILLEHLNKLVEDMIGRVRL